MKIEVDENSRVEFMGIHKGVRFIISGFMFKENYISNHEFKTMWATYILLSEKKYEEFKDKLPRLPWNGGITYNRKHTEVMLDAPKDSKYGEPVSWHKIGDDFSHSWDMERHQGFLDREYLTDHIKNIIDKLVGDNVDV